jgi:hypothetical protein
MVNYYEKYMKYKNKYILLKKQLGLGDKIEYDKIKLTNCKNNLKKEKDTLQVNNIEGTVEKITSRISDGNNIKNVETALITYNDGKSVNKLNLDNSTLDNNNNNITFDDDCRNYFKKISELNALQGVNELRKNFNKKN